MNAIPKIDMRCVYPPRYNNTWLSDFRQWYRDNEPLISEYFTTLGQFCSEEEDFFAFAVTQHDIQLANREER